MIYYTADQHFGYEHIIESTTRPFASVEEMDEALINNWNEVVSDDDTVYLIGDIGSYRTPFPAQQLSRLRGHKHLIRGNHDTCIPNQQELLDYFETVTDFLEIDDGDRHITLCHYPLVYIQGGCMIHGHLHNTRKETFRILQQLPRVLNAGVDINDYRPVTLEQLIENNRIYYNDPERGKLRQGHSGRKWDAEYHPLPVQKAEDKTAIPAIAFAAYSGTGKTTLIEKLIVAMKQKGLRLAVIKHDGHKFEIDYQGKDSWRFTHAGADISMIGSKEKIAYIESRPLTLDRQMAMCHDVDLILVEGYKNGDLPQIGIARSATGKGFTAEISRFVAVVTDMEVDGDIPHFGLEDIDAIMEFILKYLSVDLTGA